MLVGVQVGRAAHAVQKWLRGVIILICGLLLLGVLQDGTATTCADLLLGATIAATSLIAYILLHMLSHC